MSGFLYYIAGGQASSLAENKALSHVSGVPVSTTTIMSGPDHSSGMLYAPADAKGSRQVKMDLDSQEWVEFDGFWIGYEKENPPTPDDLARGIGFVDGHIVELENNFNVVVPLARRFPSGTELPELLVVGKGGVLEKKPLKKFASLSEGAERVLNVMFIDGEGLPYKDLWAIIVEALSVNYMISGHEISVLNLVTTLNIISLADALVDGPTIREQMKAEMQKKRLLEESSSSVGQEA
ncbi:MAG TPA: hypothetical protein VFM18_14205 [Methanosarcina sp.]|nr:hypothetical protein [Methanosarcina sp.]